MYRLICACGQEITVRSSQAGCEVTCDCGKQSLVPPLRVLTAHHDLNEATPAMDLPNADQATDSQGPFLHFVHCCGRVSGDGNVSSLALQNYVGLVHRQVNKAIQGLEFKAFEEFVLSFALAPDNQKRIEFDFYPKDADTSPLQLLCSQLHELSIPRIDGSPVVFAIGVRVCALNTENRSLLVLPSLSGSIQSDGIVPAIRQAFGMKPDVDKSKQLTWWQRLIERWKPKAPTALTEQEKRETFSEQEQWMYQCQQIANDYSWSDLKRALVATPEDTRYRVALAEKHAQQGDQELALKYYEILVLQFHEFTPIIGRRAALNRAAGNSREALVDFTHAIEQAPYIASYRVERAFIYLELQAWDQALMDLDEAVRLAPRNPEPYFNRAIVRLRKNQLVEAEADFLRAVQLDPNFGYAYFRLGWLYYCLEGDKANAAIECLTRALVLTDNDAFVRIHRAVAYLAQNKLALATEDCQQILSVEPDNAEAHGVLGRVLQCEGQFEEAVIACTRAIELGDEHAAVLLARAVSYASTDQPTLAILDCETVLAREPDNPLALQLQGRLLLQDGDLDAAMEAFHRARELAPDWVEPREQLSYVHLLKENPEASVDEQTQLIELHPKQASHYVNRAFAYTKLQDYSAATKDYDQAIELEPDNERLYFLRGIFRMNCQLIELALADFERVLAISGSDDNAREHRASLLLRLHRYQEAIDDYAQLIAKYPENPQAYSGRAFALTALGNNDRAEEDAKRASEISPEMADGIHRSTQIASIYRYVRSENYDAALEVTNQMVADSPEESLGYRMRAFVRWEREEYVESCEDYTRVIEMNGPTSDCLSSRGQVQAELGEWDRALADLNQAVDMARQACETIVLAYALNGRSLTLAGLERHDESKRDFDESTRLCPTNPWVYYHRGLRLFQLKEFNEAKTLLELALQHNDPPLSKRKKQRAQVALDTIGRSLGFQSGLQS